MQRWQCPIHKGSLVSDKKCGRYCRFQKCLILNMDLCIFLKRNAQVNVKENPHLKNVSFQNEKHRYLIHSSSALGYCCKPGIAIFNIDIVTLYET